MESRREFIKMASLIAGGMIMPEALAKAASIAPKPGSTVWDADHVVILMQENRSFDHSYGALKGVRGFRDPRAMTLPSGRKVWFQSNAKGETYAPFRLDIKDTRATWMRDLPHSWENQVRARNGGRYDKWLTEKESGEEIYKRVPLTLGYFSREDIPFYYAFADAFTVCDHNFSSSLTGTTPNRLYLWSGTIRENASAKANVKNEDIQYRIPAKWKSFPERLEEAGIDWRIYQNELSLPTALDDEAESWLLNFTDNPIEWFSNYHVRFHEAYQAFIKDRIKVLETKEERTAAEEREYSRWKEDAVNYSREKFKLLDRFYQNIHKKAFTTNSADPDFLKLAELTTPDGNTMKVPAGDVLYQFRKDVDEGKLPPVSWLVAPQNFSDHPSAPWYGAWYVSEVLAILTKNPEVWKKTVFILCYDENDGYFDHVPPFVAPEQNLTSDGISTLDEMVHLEHEKSRDYENIETGPIGLGYRVPLVIASPWSRGGKVSSEVFDHTSILQFLEKFLEKRYKKTVKEENISAWRRTLCGDLSSVFSAYQQTQNPEPVDRDTWLGNLRDARYKSYPANFRALNDKEIHEFSPESPWMPQQEQGIKPACPIPYELHADKSSPRQIRLAMSPTFAGKGAPFLVNYYGETFYQRHFTVHRGSEQTDTLPPGIHRVEIHAPNGFFRLFQVNDHPALTIQTLYPRNRKGQVEGDLEFEITNKGDETVSLVMEDLSYGYSPLRIKIKSGESKRLRAGLKRSYHWYDFAFKRDGDAAIFAQYSGHVETGNFSYTDPKMGGVSLKD
jgi:phospholipase C